MLFFSGIFFIQSQGVIIMPISLVWTCVVVSKFLQNRSSEDYCVMNKYVTLMSLMFHFHTLDILNIGSINLRYNNIYGMFSVSKNGFKLLLCLFSGPEATMYVSSGSPRCVYSRCTSERCSYSSGCVSGGIRITGL